MKIEILEKFLPYVHGLRAECLLPGTCIGVKLDYPDLSIGSHTMRLPHISPVRGLTLQQDLEKGRVLVFADHFHLTLTALEEEIGVVLRLESKEIIQKRLPYPSLQASSYVKERLSFGSNRAQDGEKAMRYLDLERILPWMYRLGQYHADKKAAFLPFNPHHLTEWGAYFQKEYTSLLMPCDPQKEVLSALFHTIRSFFLEEKGLALHLLSFCPFASGRITDLSTSFGTISLEWRKSRLYRAILQVHSSRQVEFVLPSSIHSFQWRKGRKDKKNKHLIEEPFFLEEDNTYFLDHFYQLSSAGLEVAIAECRK